MLGFQYECRNLLLRKAPFDKLRTGRRRHSEQRKNRGFGSEMSDKSDLSDKSDRKIAEIAGVNYRY